MHLYCLYPILLCLIPIHSLYAQNVGEIHYRDYLKTLVLFSLIISIGCYSLFVITGNMLKSELFFCLFFFVFLYAHYAFILMYSEYQRKQRTNKIKFYLLHIPIILLFITLIIKFLPMQFVIIVTKILFWMCAVLNLFVLMDIYNKLKLYLLKKEKSNDGDFSKLYQSNLPNVYHIIVDAHCGFYDKECCDEVFRNGLLDKGFHIYDNAKCNYNFTHLSVSSLLNMDYIQNLIEPTINQKYLPNNTYSLYANNLVFQKFLNKGYKLNIVMNKNLISLFEDQKDLLNLNTFKKKKNSLIHLLMFSSIFHYLFGTKKNDDLNIDVLNLFEQFLTNTKKKNIAPTFNYIHVLAPHPPYFVDENGKQNPFDRYSDHSLYNGYQKYINNYLLNFLDDLKNNIELNSIIILQGDHGREKPCNAASLASNERYHSLLAIYSPNREKCNLIKKDLSFVNLYRYIFNTFFDETYEILEDEYFKTNFGEWGLTKTLGVKD